MRLQTNESNKSIKTKSKMKNQSKRLLSPYHTKSKILH